MTRRVAWRWGVLFGLAALLASGLPTVLSAQGRPLRAFGRQDLNFGTLLPGVPTAVTRLDALNTGQFEIRGDRDNEVRLVLTLPAALVSTTGRTLPLQFGPADGGVSPESDIGSSTAFDPRVPLIARFGRNGRLYVFLGGTARPGSTQARGAYTAAITVTVAYTGV